MTRIKIDDENGDEGYFIILTNGNSICLGVDEYVVPNYVINKLKEQNIEFEIIGGEKDGC